MIKLEQVAPGQCFFNDDKDTVRRVLDISSIRSDNPSYLDTVHYETWDMIEDDTGKMQLRGEYRKTVNKLLEMIDSVAHCFVNGDEELELL